MDANNEFCLNLASQSPDLKTILDEHLEDNFDELLPHVFMGDVTRYVQRGGKDRANIVAAVEKALQSNDSGLVELVAVSFVENLETEDELNSAVKGVEAPLVVAEWKYQRSS